MSTTPPRFDYPEYEFGGYYDLGPVQIPPRITFHGLTDRVTGAVWYLAWDGVDHMVLTDQVPSGLNVRVWGPYDGPWIGTYGVKIGVSNAHLVFEAPQTEAEALTFLRGTGAPFVYLFNQLNPFQQVYPEPSNLPSSPPPTIPGVPSSTPAPTGGGYAAFMANLTNNLPPILLPTNDVNPNFWGHLTFQGGF